MIFSNKMYKLASGDNVSIYAESYDNMTMFFHNEKLCKRKILFSEIVRCVKTNTSLEYKFAKKLNEKHIFACINDDLAVINEESSNK